jgi:3-oxoacyl-[acyl-carrier-protein] synthase-3
LTLRLLGTGHCVPAAAVPNAEFAKTLDTTDEWIVRRTGIRERRLCRDETLLDLALGAAGDALEQAAESGHGTYSLKGTDPDSGMLPPDTRGGTLPPDAVIVSSSTLEYHFPPLACQIGTALGLNGPFCMDVGATCSGFVYALDIAAHYINAGSAGTVLVVAAEKLSPLVDFTDRATCILFGDGAAAAVVTKGDKPYTSYLACAADPDRSLYARTGEKMVMNGSGVYKFAVATAPGAIEAVLRKAGLGLGDIDWFILHQANIRIIESIVSRCGIDPDKVPITLDLYANPSSVTIPLTLDLMRQDGRLLPGQRVLTLGFGAGLTYGASIFEI